MRERGWWLPELTRIKQNGVAAGGRWPAVAVVPLWHEQESNLEGFDVGMWEGLLKISNLVQLLVHYGRKGGWGAKEEGKSRNGRKTPSPELTTYL